MERKQRYLNRYELFNHCKILTILMVFLCLYSCKKTQPDIDYNENPDNLHKIFLQFWDKMNNHYVYWDKDTTNWNSVFKKYQPIFEKLNDNVEDKRKAVLYFKEMTSALIDNHFSITFQDQAIVSSVINPSFDRKSRALNFHGRYNYDTIVKTYLDPGFYSAIGNITHEGTPLSVTAGTINHNLLYFHCNFFALKQSYDTSDGNKINATLNYFFSELKKKSGSFKGIILDLRNNDGGNITDLNFFIGKLINKDITFGYTRSKNGLGKWGYLPWLEAKIKHDQDYHTNLPIILLGDNFSASLAELIIIALRAEKTIFIGEQTYGATGPISDTDIFNSGSFTVGNFLTVKTSSIEFKGRDGTFYENIGISPDILSPFDNKNLTLGKDPQLELAINHIK